MSNNHKISHISTRKTLDEVDRRLIQEVIANPAASNASLARIMGMERRQIGIRRKNPEFQRVLGEYQKPAKDILKQAQPQAARVLKKQLQNDDPQIALHAATTILRPLLRTESIDENERLVIRIMRKDGHVITLDQGKDINEVI